MMRISDVSQYQYIVNAVKKEQQPVEKAPETTSSEVYSVEISAKGMALSAGTETQERQVPPPEPVTDAFVPANSKDKSEQSEAPKAASTAKKAIDNIMLNNYKNVARRYSEMAAKIQSEMTFEM